MPTVIELGYASEKDYGYKRMDDFTPVNERNYKPKYFDGWKIEGDKVVNTRPIVFEPGIVDWGTVNTIEVNILHKEFEGDTYFLFPIGLMEIGTTAHEIKLEPETINIPFDLLRTL